MSAGHGAPHPTISAALNKPDHGDHGPAHLEDHDKKDGTPEKEADHSPVSKAVHDTHQAAQGAAHAADHGHAPHEGADDLNTRWGEVIRALVFDHRKLFTAAPEIPLAKVPKGDRGLLIDAVRNLAEGKNKDKIEAITVQLLADNGFEPKDAGAHADHGPGAAHNHADHSHDHGHGAAPAEARADHNHAGHGHGAKPSPSNGAHPKDDHHGHVDHGPGAAHSHSDHGHDAHGKAHSSSKHEKKNFVVNLINTAGEFAKKGIQWLQDRLEKWLQ
jgi:hypothetical protein